jgi:Domain of unknown function (DUF4359)
VKFLLYLIGAAIAGIGGTMVITNPGRASYDEYATQQLTDYLETNVCTKAPRVLGNVLQDQCVSILQDNQTEIRQIVSNNTERQNFVVLSIYKTDLSAEQFIPPVISASVPSYHFETVGVFNRFITYQAERQ